MSDADKIHSAFEDAISGKDGAVGVLVDLLNLHDFDLASFICKRCGMAKMDAVSSGEECSPPRPIIVPTAAQS